MTSRTDVVEVPYESLKAETLQAVVEEFITRAATDYGERERSLEEKIADVMRQLEHREAVVIFDSRTDTVNIVAAGGSRHRGRRETAQAAARSLRPGCTAAMKRRCE